MASNNLPPPVSNSTETETGPKGEKEKEKEEKPARIEASSAQLQHVHGATDDHDHNDNHTHDHNDHNHSEGIGHAHLPSNLGTVFKISLTLTLLFVVGEFIAGLWANSLALISDAGHNLSDALALGFSWWALLLAKRAPTAGKTYGFHRAGILAATVNAVSLVLIAVYIFYEGVTRLLNPPVVEGWTVIVVATVALFLNSGIALMLHAGSKDDLNTRSAFIHIAGDAVSSLGVIVAGVVVVSTGWRLVDPLISMVIGLGILWSSWGVIKEATNILLEGVPEGLDMTSLMHDLMKQPGVKDVHDLHVWTIGSGFGVLSCHLKLVQNCTLVEAKTFARPIKQMLNSQYRITHATLELECEGCEQEDIYCQPLSKSK